MSNPKCDATITVDEDRELRCVLAPGHDGPVHEDADGEQWGDITLPAAHHEDPVTTP